MFYSEYEIKQGEKSLNFKTRLNYNAVYDIVMRVIIYSIQVTDRIKTVDKL